MLHNALVDTLYCYSNVASINPQISSVFLLGKDKCEEPKLVIRLRISSFQSTPYYGSVCLRQTGTVITNITTRRRRWLICSQNLRNDGFLSTEKLEGLFKGTVRPQIKTTYFSSGLWCYLSVWMVLERVAEFWRVFGVLFTPLPLASQALICSM